MTITVRFACGHSQSWEDKPADVATVPVCQTCGEHRITGTNAPKPTFRGACSSPLKKE